MSNITEVRPKGEKNALIILDDNSQVWTPDIEKAKALKIGEPIPADWTRKDGQYGPQAFPPGDKKAFGGGQAAYRNSKEGQFYEQERMDRRTALMQAVALGGEWLDTAAEMYAWLRKSAGSAHPSGSAADTGSPTPLSGEPETWRAGDQAGHGDSAGGLQPVPTSQSARPSASSPATHRPAGDTGGAAGKGTGEGPKPAAPTCPACNSPNIGRKGRTWKCGDCSQDWSADG